MSFSDGWEWDYGRVIPLIVNNLLYKVQDLNRETYIIKLETGFGYSMFPEESIDEDSMTETVSSLFWNSECLFKGGQCVDRSPSRS